MDNPEPDFALVRCPCDRPNPCISSTMTSPNGLVMVLLWECQDFTDEDITSDLRSLRDILNKTYEEDD